MITLQIMGSRGILQLTEEYLHRQSLADWREPGSGDAWGGGGCGRDRESSAAERSPSSNNLPVSAASPSAQVLAHRCLMKDSQKKHDSPGQSLPFNPGLWEGPSPHSHDSPPIKKQGGGQAGVGAGGQALAGVLQGFY